MSKSIKETSVRSPFLGKELTDEDLQTRYAEYLLTDPKLPTITTSADGATITVTSYFEDAEPKELSVVLEEERAPEIEVQPEDIDAFNLYTPDEEQSEIDWDEQVKEAPKPAPVVVREKLSGPAALRAKHLKALLSTKEYLLRTAKRVLEEQASLPQALDGDDAQPTRDAILAELHLYSIGINTRKWAHKKQLLDDQIAFAATDAGKAADMVLDAEMKAQRKLKDKEKKQRQREKKAAEMAKKNEVVKGKGGKKGKGADAGKGGIKMGRHEVRDKVKGKSDGKGKGRVEKNEKAGRRRGKKGGNKGRD
ncbi:hypothetical protein GLAREA_09342 [Glarea lozoyensis ATCC 20868]|uniref:Uncharacterized protein n=2 Tax=Glarea lozoyensis TaxID=101852 RepID=S3CP11_GLAL2|nr:uncharacterized protein GLAREA_09342 [Glarea lozoyensis ATCC 20868]EHL03255.1 hypothetical protein M7I_0470 [Glarea lozoyensis 74030]EPE28222.1 hypothetical protein GLAREA_09342 [Glarea lozoyensis ATCC 20868]